HVYLDQKKPAEAIAEFEQAASTGAASDSAQLAYGYAATNRRAEAQAIVRSLVASGKTRYLAPANMALAYFGLGNDGEAWRWLDPAVTAHDPMVTTVFILPAYRRVLADPRFPAMLHRFGILP